MLESIYSFYHFHEILFNFNLFNHCCSFFLCHGKEVATEEKHTINSVDKSFKNCS